MTEYQRSNNNEDNNIQQKHIQVIK